MAASSILDLRNVNFSRQLPKLTFEFAPAPKGTYEVKSKESLPYPDLIKFYCTTSGAKNSDEFYSILFKSGENIRKFHFNLIYTGIPATEARKFFDAIRWVQKNGAGICVPTILFQKTLGLLRRYEYMTDQEIQSLDIQTSDTFEEYRKKVEEEKDVKGALSLANYYRSTDTTCAIHWLANAHLYAQGLSLDGLVDLDEFFRGFESLNSMDSLSGWTQLALAVARCPTIKELYVSPYESFSEEMVKSIGLLLEQMTSVTRVYICSSNPSFEKKLNSQMMAPIARGLTVNKSVQSFSVVHSPIGDEGVLKLLQALRENPDSQVSSLSFRNCNLTDVSAEELFKYMQEKPKMAHVDLAGNDISIEWKEKFEKINKERAPLLPPQTAVAVAC